jgi:hypothetical protein
MKLALAVLGASLALGGCATGPNAVDHAAHPPPGSAAQAPGRPTHGQMDSTMKSMQEMHGRMMAAKTPEERAKLMQEHMKAMQDGMAMMEMMMQMMMDREGARPPAAK